jgi:uncharacterized membrane protein YeaQ/YmgE (transglycosylase-associated protein family)
MSLFAWLLLGLVAGFIASHMVNHRGEGMVLDILLGIVGAILGGWIFHYFGAPGVTRLSLYSLVVAVAGSVLFLVVYHAIRRGIAGRRTF